MAARRTGQKIRTVYVYDYADVWQNGRVNRRDTGRHQQHRQRQRRTERQTDWGGCLSTYGLACSWVLSCVDTTWEAVNPEFPQRLNAFHHSAPRHDRAASKSTSPFCRRF